MSKLNTKNWSKRKLLSYTVISVLFILLLLEGIFRIWFAIKFKGMHTSVYIQGSPMQVVDPVTGYNNRAYYVDYEKRFQFNEQGMISACGNYSMPVKQSNEIWILLMGGSAMEGMGSNKDGEWFDMTNIMDHPYHENIAYYLEKSLQGKILGTNIRVFNTAVSGFDVHQGIERYKYLSSRYNFDWVISMDGVNEQDTLITYSRERSYASRYKPYIPFTKFPLKYIVPVTQNSALINMIKQELFYLRLKARAYKDKANNFKVRRQWESRPCITPTIFKDDKYVRNAVNFFIDGELAFQRQLEIDKKNYLLLVQPYLLFKDSSHLTQVEKALYNYQVNRNEEKYKASFLKMVHDSIETISAKNRKIQNMDNVYLWPGWTFVDYCHFTKEANKRIAEELAQYILKEGKYIPVKS